MRLGSMGSGRGHNREEANKVIWNNLPAELVDTSAAGKLFCIQAVSSQRSLCHCEESSDETIPSLTIQVLGNI